MAMRVRVMGAAAVCAALAAGCGTVSDDPRQGGLAGYVVHGPKAYERRLESRRGELGATEEKTREEEARKADLDNRRGAIVAKIEAMEKEFQALEQETEAISGDLGKLKAANAEAEQEKNRLAAQLDQLRKDAAAIKDNPGMLLQEKQKRLEQLQEEVRQLRQRTARLMEL